jgi:hypothetical protein
MLDRSIITSHGGGNVYIYTYWFAQGRTGGPGFGVSMVRRWLVRRSRAAFVSGQGVHGFGSELKEDNYQVGYQFWEGAHARSGQGPGEKDIYDILNWTRHIPSQAFSPPLEGHNLSLYGVHARLNRQLASSKPCEFGPVITLKIITTCRVGDEPDIVRAIRLANKPIIAPSVPQVRSIPGRVPAVQFVQPNSADKHCRGLWQWNLKRNGVPQVTETPPLAAGQIDLRKAPTVEPRTTTWGW